MTTIDMKSAMIFFGENHILLIKNISANLNLSSILSN